MKKRNLMGYIALGVLALWITACSKNDNPTPPVEESSSRYVLITLADRVSGNKGGFVSSFATYPTGVISNATANSLEGQGMGGWRVHNNMIFKMFSTAGYVSGIEKIEVSKDGKVTAGKFISSKIPTEAAKYFGTGNLVIQNDDAGYYWDAAEPLKVQKFNPTTMVNTGSVDLSAAVNARGKDEALIKFRAAGQKFLAIKGGKLYVNLTYAKNDASQVGFFDDFYTDVYLAVVDIATGTYEKTITIKETGSIAYINENHMYDFDTNGDLYIVTQGRTAVGGKSKIVRIKAAETDIDSSWELKFSDFRAADDGKFTNVFAKDGRLIFTLNTEKLTGGATGNINSEDIWKFYSLNVSDRKFNAITGVPTGTNPGAAMVAVEVDGKVLLRGATKAGENGYYEYNAGSNTATNSFSVNVGGAVSGFVKVQTK
ncbi:hypothetical protein ACR79M_01670 [Sphingobacterium spiritivorum]|uniref:hypothetical protein n=1 Tax=Sphingobacterium spiritivorum TaxID=258 RepID=UPI003DA65781